MNRRAALLCWLGIAVVFSSDSAGLSETAPDPEQLAARVDELLVDLDRPDGFAATVGIVRRGALIYRRDFGLANREHGVPTGPESVYSLASMSKQFAAFATLLLAREGRLRLTDDIRIVLPEMPTYDPADPITIADLMHHTSGLRDHLTLAELAGARMNEDFLGIDEQYRLIVRQRGLCFPTGQRYMYSNTAYFLLALIVERVSGLPFGEYLGTRVFEPLGMTHSFVMDDPHTPVPGRVQGSALDDQGRYRILENTFPNFGYAGVLSTLNDLVKWVDNFDHPVIGDPWVIEQMRTPGRTDSGEEVGYGGGLFIDDHRGYRLLEHSGGEEGFRSQFWVFPDEGFSIITLGSGGRDMAELIDPVIPRIADLMLGVEASDGARLESDDSTADVGVAQPPKSTYATAPERLRLFEGRYSRPDPGDELMFISRDGTLEWSYYRPGQRGPTTTALLVAEGPRHFSEPTTGGESFTFEDGRGRPSGFVELREPGLSQPLLYERMAPPPNPLPIVGSYFSEDLGVVWALSLEDELIQIRLPRRAGRQLFDHPHKYVGEDTFVAPLQHNPRLRLHRDAQGAVAGFTWEGFNLITLEFTRIDSATHRLPSLSLLQRPEGVMVRGRWLSRDDLDHRPASLTGENDATPTAEPSDAAGGADQL